MKKKYHSIRVVIYIVVNVNFFFFLLVCVLYSFVFLLYSYLLLYISLKPKTNTECVCACVWARGTDRDKLCKSVWVCERQSQSECLSVWQRERERERVSVSLSVVLLPVMVIFVPSCLYRPDNVQFFFMYEYLTWSFLISHVIVQSTSLSEYALSKAMSHLLKEAGPLVSRAALSCLSTQSSVLSLSLWQQHVFL